MKKEKKLKGSLQNIIQDAPKAARKKAFWKNLPVAVSEGNEVFLIFKDKKVIATPEILRSIGIN
ncbi:MAG TPA: hypothetical protein VK907_00225, partial [Phnomibacter sp.]|nr:hypothetical protein [Phnomibacter sp.]